MAWNGRAPADRASAAIGIVMGSLVLLFGLGFAITSAINDKLDDLTFLGIPVWISAAGCVVFGIVAVWRSIIMYRRDQSPRR
ncbi:hypothetical protein ACFM35_00025 [Microbacterium sp. P01]|uniref:hypothetical protein n=1 Tax=Microbacterium sp. P01 TaxID=3366261 RepID=UPI00366DD87E